MHLPQFPATPAPLSPNSQRGSFHVHFPMHTGKRRGRGSRAKFPAFHEPLPAPLPGLSSVTQASPCGHHVSLRRRSSPVPEPPPPPRAQWVGRVVLPWPSPGGRGPRASCVAAQTRLVGAAHAAAGRRGAGQRGAGCRATNARPHPRTPTHTLPQPPRPQKLTRRSPSGPAPPLG